MARASQREIAVNGKANRFLRKQAFIAGQWCDAAGENTFTVDNPANGEAITEVADCGVEDAAAAIAAAERAFKPWSSFVAAERSAILRRWHDLMLRHEQDLAEIITAEMGKPLAEAVGEVRYGAAYLEWYVEEAKRIYGDIIPSASNTSRVVVVKQPVGVCAAITPWNFPNAMLMRKAAAALAAGCTMVAKPAEDTPLSALAVAALAEEAGVPAGVFNVVPTTDAAGIGLELTTNPAVRKVSFTGSTEIGRLLLAQSASTVKKVSMELGGNAPFIVFPDADLEAAIDGAMASKYRNAGQTCVCANRLFVHADIYDAFCDKLSQRVAALRVGPGTDNETMVGPLINAQALDKIEALMAGATSDGATVKQGGRRHSAGALFFEPTVLSGVTPDMDIAKTEIFGPVAAVLSFRTEEDVIAAANATPFGLAAYLYTKDLGRAWRVGEALEYGMVGVNEGVISAVSAPFGGVKQSGMGREGSKYGLDDYLETKYLCMGGLSG